MADQNSALPPRIGYQQRTHQLRTSPTVILNTKPRSKLSLISSRPCLGARALATSRSVNLVSILVFSLDGYGRGGVRRRCSGAARRAKARTGLVRRGEAGHGRAGMVRGSLRRPFPFSRDYRGPETTLSGRVGMCCPRWPRTAEKSRKNGRFRHIYDGERWHLLCERA
jgi:hypothetical protein